MLENQSKPIDIIIDAEGTTINENQESYQKEARNTITEHLRQCRNKGKMNIVNQYLNDSITWEDFSKHLIKEEISKEKVIKPTKGPLMINKRENRNMRKARIYRFTQRSYQQNRKAAITKILDNTFSLDNESEVTRKIEDIEEVYVKHPEEGNRLDDSPLLNTESKQSHLYGRITG